MNVNANKTLERNMRIFLENIEKYAQDVNQAKPTTPKYNRAIKANTADINLALADLNAAKTLTKPEESAANACIQKVISYLSFFRSIGAGGDVGAVGKEELIPSPEEMKSMIKTGLFGEAFIMSLASILKLNESIPQFKNEFATLSK